MVPSRKEPTFKEFYLVSIGTLVPLSTVRERVVIIAAAQQKPSLFERYSLQGVNL